VLFVMDRGPPPAASDRYQAVEELTAGDVLSFLKDIGPEASSDRSDSSPGAHIPRGVCTGDGVAPGGLPAPTAGGRRGGALGPRVLPLSHTHHASSPAQLGFRLLHGGRHPSPLGSDRPPRFAIKKGVPSTATTSRQRAVVTARQLRERGRAPVGTVARRKRSGAAPDGVPAASPPQRGGGWPPPGPFFL
jgi:hypothetical protein